MPIKTVNIDSTAKRGMLILAAFICLISVFFTAKWCLGYTIATRVEYKEIADLTTSLAPSDPQTHYASAVLFEKTFLPDDLQKSLAEYEKAAGLAPWDFRLWLALGKARGTIGDPVGAEKALRRALELAPNYSEVHWTLGNNFLRQGRLEEGFAKIRQAADGDVKYAIPAVTIAWQILDADTAKVRQNLGDEPKMNAALSLFLIQQARYDEAFEIWSDLPDDLAATAFRAQSEQIYNALAGVKKYRYALQIKARLEQSENKLYAVGKITNGGFENNVKQEKAGLYEWQIGDGHQPLIGFDDQVKHGGNLSLVIIFNSPDGRDFRPVSQLAAVQKSKAYRFETFYKAELKSSATLRWEIADALDGKILATSEAISTNAGWTKIGLDFSTSPDAEAVIIRLARVVCGSTICPITGKVWFDDFTLIEK